METVEYNLASINITGRMPLSEQVYLTIRTAIINGILPPDTKLNETTIAEQLSVSATPVREAFRKLAVDGLVVIAPWKGVRVKGYSTEEIIEMYQLREVIEGLSARLAAANMDDDLIKELRAVYDAALEAKEPQKYVELHSLFHALIIDASGNKRIKNFMKEYKELIDRDMLLTTGSDERLQKCQDEHLDILRALSKHDGAAAEAAMRVHIRNAFDYKKQKFGF